MDWILFFAELGPIMTLVLVFFVFTHIWDIWQLNMQIFVLWVILRTTDTSCDILGHIETHSSTLEHTEKSWDTLKYLEIYYAICMHTIWDILKNYKILRTLQIEWDILDAQDTLEHIEKSWDIVTTLKRTEKYRETFEIYQDAFRYCKDLMHLGPDTLKHVPVCTETHYPPCDLHWDT